MCAQYAYMGSIETIISLHHDSRYYIYMPYFFLILYSYVFLNRNRQLAIKLLSTGNFQQQMGMCMVHQTTLEHSESIQRFKCLFQKSVAIFTGYSK